MYRRCINLKWLYDERIYVYMWFCKFGILRPEASLFPSRYTSDITRKIYFLKIIPLIEVYVLIIQESLSVGVSEETI